MSITSASQPATIINTALALLALVLFTGCGSFTRTTYQRPELNLPETWACRPADTPQSLPATRWWQVFRDPALENLIDKALEANNDLGVATIKVRKARLEAGLTATDLLPDLSVSTNASLKKTLKTGGSSKSFGTTTSLSWELDLWGRLASSRDAAEWEALATEEDRANTALSLVGTTADLYWQIAYLNQAIRTSQESIEYTRKTREIVQVKYEAGEVSELDLLQADQDMESQKADLADLSQQIAEARNALTILFNQPPGQVLADPGQLTEMPLPELEPGIPAQVLANRPDLKAAELRLKQTLAEGDATRLSYYPALSLTGKLGTSSVTLQRLLENPVAALGAGLALPFVQWNERKFKVKIAEEEFRQAVTEFRQTLYEALQDVENALSARSNYLVQEKALHRSLELSQKAEQVAEVRYRAGKTGVQDWLDQQETRRKADLALAKNRYNQLNNLMTLYMALGGDPDLTEPVTTPQS